MFRAHSLNPFSFAHNLASILTSCTVVFGSHFSLYRSLDAAEDTSFRGI